MSYNDWEISTGINDIYRGMYYPPYNFTEEQWNKVKITSLFKLVTDSERWNEGN